MAASIDSDEHHARALELIKQSLDEKEKFLITDHVLDEAVTFINAKAGKNKAFEQGEKLLKSSDVTIEYCSPPRSQAAMRLLGKIDGLSFCDALSAVVMRELGIKRIYSFDSDFDNIPGIERIE